MRAVLKHELRDYFNSLPTYLFCAFLLCFVGVGAMLYNIQSAVANFEYVLQFVSIGMAVIIPILTMRSISEERRQKTDQLLYSLPIRISDIVAGKYLAMLIIFLIPVCIIAVFPLIFSQFGEVYLPTSYGSLFAFFMMGAAMIAFGMFVSSMTDSQALAAGIAIVILMLNYFKIPGFMEKISLFEKFNGFVSGVFDISSIVFYVTVIIFFLFLTVQSLERRRYS